MESALILSPLKKFYRTAINYNAEFYDFAGWKPLEFDKWLDILKSKPMVKFYVGFYDSEWGYY